MSNYSYNKKNFSEIGLDGIKTDFFYAVALRHLKGNFWRLVEFEKRFARKIRDFQLAENKFKKTFDSGESLLISQIIQDLRSVQNRIGKAIECTDNYVNFSLENVWVANEGLRKLQDSGFGTRLRNALRRLLKYYFQQSIKRLGTTFIEIEGVLLDIIAESIRPKDTLKCFDLFAEKGENTIAIILGGRRSGNSISDLIDEKKIHLSSIPAGYFRSGPISPDSGPIYYDFSGIETTIETLNKKLGLDKGIDNFKKMRQFQIAQKMLSEHESIPVIKEYKNRSLIIHFLSDEKDARIFSGEAVSEDKFWNLSQHLELEVESEKGDFLHCKVVEEKNTTIIKLLTLPNRNEGWFKVTSHATVI